MAADLSSITDQPSAFASVLRYLGRPAYTIRNLLTGNVEGAARQVGDLFGDTIDAFLPGDLVPELSRKQDYAEASDLIGGMEPGIAKTGVDIVGGVLTDPLTLVGGSLFKAAGQGVAAGVNAAKAAPIIGTAVTEAAKYGDKALLGLKSMTGNLNVAEPARQAIEAGTAVQQGTQEAALAASRKVLENIRPGEEETFGRILHNLDVADDGTRAPIIGATPNTPAAIQTEAVLKKLEPYQSPGAPLTAGDAYKMVKKPGTTQPVSAIDRALGIGGVVDDPVADAAAERALQSYPVLPTDPRFTSGIDIANAGYGIDVALPRLRPDRLLGGAKEAASMAIPSPPIRDQWLASRATVPQSGINPGAVERMLGAQATPAVTRPGIELVADPGKAAMFSGGMSPVVPEMRRVPADEIERALFTERGKLDDVFKTLDTRIDAKAAAGEITAEQAARFKAAGRENILKNQTAWEERVKSGAMNPQVGTDLKNSASTYFPRNFLDEESIQSMLPQRGTGGISSANMRKLNTPEAVADFLNKNPNITLEENAAKVLGTYDAQQAKLLGKAAFANKLIEPYVASGEAKLAKGIPLDDVEKMAVEAKGSSLYSMGEKGNLGKTVDSILEQVGKNDPESALALSHFWSGMPPREGMWKALATVNQMFKPYATAGAFIPRINFSLRNIVGGAFSVAAEKEARGQFGNYIKQIPSIFGRSIDDGIEKLTGGRIGTNEFQIVNDAFRNSRGSMQNTIDALPEGTLKEAVRNGVITDGFANTELLAKEISKPGWRKRLADIRDWPAEIAAGVEKRMRLAVYDGLLKDGIAPVQAARIVKDTFFDYSMSSASNRAARDVIPFFQFTAKAVPQMYKAMRDNPFIIPAVRPLFNKEPGTILPEYLQDNMSIPLGEGENGQPRYLTSLGIPIEVLTQIPNPSGSIQELGQQVRRNIIGASNPAIKTAYSVIAGVDPNFGSTFMSYDKAPQIAQTLGADEKSEAARIYNALAGTGIIQPIVSPVNVLSGMVDSRRTGLESLINGLTGLQIKTVDEKEALKQLIEQYLQSNPDVQSSRNFFQFSKDQETQDAIKQLGQLKRELKAQRQAATD